MFKYKTMQADYNSAVKSLFHSYLINSYSLHIENGGYPLMADFTSMAKSQPLSFAGFCSSLQKGANLESSGHYNTETMQLIGAKNMLSDYSYNQKYLADCCSVVSKVYECALATSLSSQQKLEQRGVDAKNAELNVSGLKELQENYKTNPMFAFTSKPFERNGCATVENARDTINQINSLDLNYVPWALDLITESTETAQKTMVIMHADFDASMGITD